MKMPISNEGYLANRAIETTSFEVVLKRVFPVRQYNVITKKDMIYGDRK